MLEYMRAIELDSELPFSNMLKYKQKIIHKMISYRFIGF